MQHVTLLFLRRNNQVLLAMKKRGFGAGKWNGAGGKLEPNETPTAAAIRECQEEVGVTPSDLQAVGEIDFYDKAADDFHHHMHIFTAHKWDGDPTETEEMRPEWFAVNALPYATMWAADKQWIPLVLDGKTVHGTIIFNGDTLVSNDITTA
jgi:mutator protein MutT